MTRYKIYDRLTLELRDSGVVRDYVVDLDYLTNNNSTMRLVRESKGFKGDILAISEGVDLIALGVITAIDNTELRIQFKHMKELFNDSILNVFKWTGLLDKKFDAVQGLRVLIEYAFINTTDSLRRLPLTIRTFGQNLNAVWIDDSDTIDMQYFIDWCFDHYNIYINCDIDFANKRIIVDIIKNDTEGLILKDNIKLSKPEFDSQELPRENRALLFNKYTGVIVNSWFLLQNNTLTTNANHPQRLYPVSTRHVEWDEVDAIREGYTQEDLVKSEIQGNVYNHCVQVQLAKKQTMMPARRFNYGDQVRIVYEGRSYDTIFTGLKFRKDNPFYTCIFGHARIDFTDRMKIFNKRQYQRRT
ncbi:MAG: hypothetical protein FWE03_00405 [Firmicutes bacterium]|nr:hypothetical protein [Bacillota bacterium]